MFGDKLIQRDVVGEMRGLHAENCEHISFNRTIKAVSEIAPHFLSVRKSQVLTKLSVLLALTGHKILDAYSTNFLIFDKIVALWWKSCILQIPLLVTFLCCLRIEQKLRVEYNHPN